MTRRFLAIALFAILAACGKPPASEGSQTEGEPRNPDVPQIARITCGPGGSTDLQTPAVSALADGVHILVRNDAGEPVSLSGLGLDFDTGGSEQVATTAPGTFGIACWPYSLHDSGDEPETQPLRIEDPHGHWATPELDCPGGGLVEDKISDFIPGATGEKGDPVALTRRHLTGLEDGDVVESAGYPDAAHPTVRVVRDGHTVATTGFIPAENGGWLLENSSTCADSRITQS
jgi:hypothetical protein